MPSYWAEDQPRPQLPARSPRHRAGPLDTILTDEGARIGVQAGIERIPGADGPGLPRPFVAVLTPGGPCTLPPDTVNELIETLTMARDTAQAAATVEVTT